MRHNRWNWSKAADLVEKSTACFLVLHYSHSNQIGTTLVAHSTNTCNNFSANGILDEASRAVRFQGGDDEEFVAGDVTVDVK